MPQHLSTSSDAVVLFSLLQGPTGVSGPKGARGAQGPPVSKTPSDWPTAADSIPDLLDEVAGSLRTRALLNVKGQH